MSDRRPAAPQQKLPQQTPVVAARPAVRPNNRPTPVKVFVGAVGQAEAPSEAVERLLQKRAARRLAPAAGRRPHHAPRDGVVQVGHRASGRKRRRAARAQPIARQRLNKVVVDADRRDGLETAVVAADKVGDGRPPRLSKRVGLTRRRAFVPFSARLEPRAVVSIKGVRPTGAVRRPVMAAQTRPQRVGLLP